MEQEGRGVGTEDDLARVRPREIGGRPARLRDDDVRLLARRERTVRVAHPSSVVARHRLDHGVGDLGAAGRIHQDHGAAVLADASERRETGTDAPEVDHGHRLPHAVSGGNRELTHPITPGSTSHPFPSSGTGQPGSGRQSSQSRSNGGSPASTRSTARSPQT